VPIAVQVGIGGVNAVTGQSWDFRPAIDPQNYIVCPDQPWIDGVLTASGVVRQFLAVSTGSGYAVAEQLPGADISPGIHLRAYPPRPERLADIVDWATHREDHDVRVAAAGDLGVGSGGRMRQRIYPDRYGVEVWDRSAETGLSVHLVVPGRYAELTGEEPPSSPITARDYTDAGLPWFDLDDENVETLPATEDLATISSVREVDQDHNVPVAEEEVTQLRREQIQRIQRGVSPRDSQEPRSAI